jgi:hypothetical protein
MTRAAFLAALGALSATSGCSGSTTTQLVVQVSYNGTSTAPTGVTVTIFDPYGEVGTKTIAPAVLPGQLVVTGLRDAAVELRIAAVGIGGGQRILGATRVTTKPHQSVPASVVLSPSTTDGDFDGVPDTIDDCPTVPDPTQADASGAPPGDACAGPGADFAGVTLDLAGADLAGVDLAGGDLAVAPPVDLAGTPPPDMMRPGSNCAALTTALLCDGFESTTFASRWTVVSGSSVGGTATIDNTHVYRGNYALHLHNDAVTLNSGSDVELDETSAFASHFYARAFVYVPTGFTTAATDIMIVEESNSPYAGITLNLNNGSFQTDGSSMSGLSPAGVVMGSSTPMPTGTWVCLEWEVKLGASSGSPAGYTNLLVDGVAANGLSGSQSIYGASGNPINMFALVMVGNKGTPARDLWMDEVVLDTQPIGCTK